MIFLSRKFPGNGGGGLAPEILDELVEGGKDVPLIGGVHVHALVNSDANAEIEGTAKS